MRCQMPQRSFAGRRRAVLLSITALHGCAAVTLSCVAAGAATARTAAAQPRWKVSLTDPGYMILTVTATGPKDAWAIAENPVKNVPNQLLHWDGTKWRPVQYPPVGTSTFQPRQV